ncbi:MAG: serine hydrolase [Bradymonadales bacterium]
MRKLSDKFCTIWAYTALFSFLLSCLQSVSYAQNVEEMHDAALKQLVSLQKPPEYIAKKRLTGWFKLVEEKADRDYLQNYFNIVGYKPPPNTYALIARVAKIKSTISLQYFSLGDTAFTYSMTDSGEQNYWPASTVKLLAAVAALIKAQQLGIDSEAQITFSDIDEDVSASLAELCTAAIVASSNPAYNQLMLFAGVDEANKTIRQTLALPQTVLLRRYARKRPDDNLRYSPIINYNHENKSGQIAERYSKSEYPQCPREANCTNLVELADLMLRVVLHNELPPKYRLPLAAKDIDMLNNSLLKAPSCIKNAVRSTMGARSKIFNKGGKVIGDDRLEVAVLSAHKSKERYLIALSMPQHDLVEEQTNELARQLILAMRVLAHAQE